MERTQSGRGYGGLRRYSFDSNLCGLFDCDVEAVGAAARSRAGIVNYSEGRILAADKTEVAIRESE
jgi:hypothetical protein